MPNSKKQSSGDYDGWILRLIDKIEDLKYTWNMKDWVEFAESKIKPRQGHDLTTTQIGSLVTMAYEFPPEKLGVKIELKASYRDSRTGKFTKEDNPFAVIKEVNRYRNIISEGFGQKYGTMVSAQKINDKISELKADKWTTVNQYRLLRH